MAQSRRSTFPTAGDMLALLGIFFLAEVVVMLVASLVLLLSGRGVADLTAEGQGAYLAVTTFLSMGATAVLFVRYRRARGAAPLTISFSLRSLRPLLLGWSLLLMMAFGVLFEPLYELLPPLHQEVGSGFWSVVAVVVFAPVFEEFLCRGFLFGSLRQRYGTTRAVLFSALFFGILHLQPVAVVNAFLMGVVLAVVYALSRTLWAPILLHAANNALAYLLIRLGYEQATFRELFDGHTIGYAIFYGLALVACFWSFYRLWKLLPRTAFLRKN